MFLIGLMLMSVLIPGFFEVGALPAADEESVGKPRGCPLPEFPAHGSYVLMNEPNRKIVPGDVVGYLNFLLYACDTGYELNTEETYCQKSNTWNTQPTCTKQCILSPAFTVDFTCSNSENAITWGPCPFHISDGTYVMSKCKDGFIPVDQLSIKMIKCENGHVGVRPKCKPDCGLEKSLSVTHIHNAATAEPNTFPWHVGIYKEVLDEEGLTYNEQICGGSILYSYIIISAAHCFWDANKEKAYPPEKYSVAAGKFLRSWDTEKNTITGVQKRKVYEIRIPEAYSGAKTNHGSDLAMLVLKEALSFTLSVRAVCFDIYSDTFNENQLRDGNFGKVAGWGIDELGAPSEMLRSVSLPVINTEVCKKEFDQYQYWGYPASDKLCAGYTNGTAVCQGDSGGGLVFPYEDGKTGIRRWFLRGIVSHGPLADDGKSCRPNTYTVFAKFYSMRDWIKKKLQNVV